MKHLTIIPCYSRPEFLHYTLRHIEQAELSDQMMYLFSLDSGYTQDHWEVLNTFKYPYNVIQRGVMQYKLTKQSYNLLKAYEQGVLLSDKYIFMIEDDIFISKDFFKWHIEVQEKENPFCSIASKNNNTNFKTTTDLTAYYNGHPTDYQSLGVCFNKCIIAEHIIPHINSQYFENPVYYCQIKFPDAQKWIGHAFVEQDGLIRRIKANLDLKTIYPHVARCYHAGFYGYNRNLGKEFTGTLQDRINKLKPVFADVNKYKQSVQVPAYFTDSEPTDLNINNTKPLHYAKAEAI